MHEEHRREEGCAIAEEGVKPQALPEAAAGRLGKNPPARPKFRTVYTLGMDRCKDYFTEICECLFLRTMLRDSRLTYF